MTVDRGGLRYDITVDAASATTAVGTLRQEIAALKAELAALSSSAAPLRAAAKAGKDAVKSSKDAARATDLATEKEVKGSKVVREAKKRIRRETFESRVEEAKATIEVEKNVRAVGRLRTEEEKTTAARRKASRIEASRGESRRIEQELARKGISLNEEERRALGLLSARTLQLARAQERLARARRALGDSEIFGAQAEAARLEAEIRRRTQAAIQQVVPNERFDARTKALREYNKEVERSATAQAKATLEVRRSLNNARRQLTEDEKRVSAERALTQILDRRQRVQRILNAASERGIVLSTQEAARIGALTTQQRLLLRAQQQLEAARLGATDTEVIRTRAETRALAAKRRELERIAENEARARLGLGPLGGGPRGPKPPDEKQISFFERFRRTLNDTDNAANRVSFTFRRLFGILAAFTAARLALRGLRNLITETIRYSAAIEQAELGIASLFVAVGDVRDAFGASVGSAQGLVIAQTEARRQMAFLRRDALITAATFEELLDAFQVAVAPGLEAGLLIDQVRKFTLDISRAATAISLPQNQLAEEIRSILAGTITPRNTRIAVALGITNEDIRNAKESGELFEFLQDRFAAFEEAGKRALTTFSALAANLKGGLFQVLEAGGIGFFTELKDVLTEIFDVILVRDPVTDLIAPDPRVVQIAKVFADSLTRALQSAREIGKSLTFSQGFASAEAVGKALEAVAVVITGLIAGAIRGFEDLGRIARGIGAVISAAFGRDAFDLSTARDLAAIIGRILTIWLGVAAVTAAIKVTTFGLALIWGGLGPVGKAFSLILNAIIVKTGIIAALSAIIQGPFFIVAAILVGVVALAVAVGVALTKWANSLLGIELKLSTIAKIFKEVLLFNALLTINAIRTALAVITSGIELLVRRNFNEIKSSAQGTILLLLDLAGTINKTAAASANALRGQLKGSRAAEKAEIEQLQVELAKRLAELKKERAGIFADLANNTLGAIADNDDALTLGEMIAEGVKLGIDIVNPLIDKLFDSFQLPDVNFPEPDAEPALRLLDAYDKIASSVSTQSRGLEANAELMRSLRDAALDAADALDSGTRTIGLDRTAAAVRQSFLEAETRFRRENIALTEEEERITLRRNGLLNQIQRNEGQIVKLSTDQQVALEASDRILRSVAEKTRERFETEARLNSAINRSREAQERGFRDDAARLRETAKLEEERLGTLDQEISAMREMAEAVLAAGSSSEQERESAIRALTERLRANSELSSSEDALKGIEADRLNLSLLLNEALVRRLSLTAALEADELRRQAASLNIENARERAADAADRSLFAAERRRLLADAEVASIRATIADLETDRARSEADLLLAITQAEQRLVLLNAERQKIQAEEGSTLDIVKEILATEQAINALKELSAQRSLTIEQQQDAERRRLERAREEAEDAQRAEDQPIQFGFVEGAKAFVDQASDIFTQFRDQVQATFESLASTIGKSLTDALTGQGGGFREAFNSFLNSIAEAFITMFARIAIARVLALGVSGASGGGGVTSSGIGAARGGSTSRLARSRRRTSRKPPSSPWSGAQGFARGGAPGSKGSSFVDPSIIRQLRPNGLDPTDTIPIWTAPGEWIIRAKAVKRYGHDVMDAINRMLVDPTALRAVAGVTSRGRAVTRVGKGAASGGQVTRSSGGMAASSMPAMRGPMTAIIAADESTMQQLLHGGRDTMLQFLREHRASYAARDAVKG